MARRNPKWATPDRQAYLVRLFLISRGFCVYGHKPCPIPEHHYELYIESVISNWVSDDKAQRQADWQAERRQLHSLAERRYPLHGQFSAVSKDIFLADQPQYYLEGLGINGLTFKPFAKVRVASSFIHLYIEVDLSNILKGVSKAKRRKAIRYGKALPEETQKQINQLCNLAVRHYLEH